MKEVQIVVRCDKCGGKGAETYTEENSKGKPVEIDLDAPCRAEHEKLKEQYAEAVAKAALILTPIRELADSAGMKPGQGLPKPKPASKTGTGDRVCILCWETRGSDNGMTDHIERDHGLPRSLTEMYGNVCPVDGTDGFSRLAMHFAQGHKGDFTHYSQGFVWAKQNGDPHKVLASRVAALKKVAKAA